MGDREDGGTGTPAGQVILSTVVMTHPGRAALAHRMRELYPELGIRVVTDPQPGAEPGTLRTARLAWDRVAAGATHQMVLQDDIELCEDFPQIVLGALRSHPGEPLAFFTNWASRTAQAVRLAAVAGASWARVIDPYVPTQALVMPARLAHGFAEYTAGLGDGVPDDQAVGGYLSGSGVAALVSVPNLAEHTMSGSLLWHDIVMGVRRSVVFSRNPQITPPWYHGSMLAPAGIPHLETWTGYSMVYFPGRREGSHSRPAHELLADTGIKNSHLVTWFRSDLQQAPPPGPARSALGPPFMFQLWLTSFMTGMAASQILGSTDPSCLDKAMGAPFARQALGTLPAGALRRIIPAGRLTGMAANLAPFCAAALRSGFTTTGGGRWCAPPAEPAAGADGGIRAAAGDPTP